MEIQVCHDGGADKTAAAGTEDTCWTDLEDAVWSCDTGMELLVDDKQDSDEDYFPVMVVPGWGKAGDFVGVTLYPSVVGQSVEVLAQLHHTGSQCYILDPEIVLEEPDCEGVLAPAFQAEFVTLD